MIKKSIRCLGALILFGISSIAANPAPIVLSSEIIKLIDGKSYGVTGYKIKSMLQLILKLNIMLDGSATEPGLYTFEGKSYCVKALAELEQTASFDGAQKQQFAALLEDVKKDFEQKTTPFMEDARGTKAQLFMLIQESCTKHARPDSFLLKWAEAEEGNEMLAMREDIHTFAALKQFILDLIMFNKDMIKSCPKAVAQYQELKAQFGQQHKGTDKPSL